MTPKITILFIGGLGISVLEYLELTNFNNKTLLSRLNTIADLYAVDTRIGQGIQINGVKRITAETLGAGGNIEVAKQSFNRIESQVTKIVSESDFIFLVAGFGGGTGTAYTSKIVEICKHLNKQPVIIATSPKTSEQDDIDKMTNYETIINEIHSQSSYSIIDLLRLEEYTASQHPSSLSGFVSMEVWKNLNGFFTLQNKSGIDFADIRKAFSYCGEFHLAHVKGENYKDLYFKALDTKLYRHKILNISSNLGWFLGDWTNYEVNWVHSSQQRKSIQNAYNKYSTSIMITEQKELLLLNAGMNSTVNKESQLTLDFDCTLFDEIIEANPYMNKNISNLSKSEKLRLKQDEILNYRNLNPGISKLKVAEWINDNFHFGVNSEDVRNLLRTVKAGNNSVTIR